MSHVIYILMTYEGLIYEPYSSVENLVTLHFLQLCVQLEKESIIYLLN